jgi:hypothetical protein
MRVRMVVVVMVMVRMLVRIVADISRGGGRIVIGTLAAIEVAYCSSEFVTFLPLEEQLSDFFATAFIFNRGRRFVLFLVLVLVVDRTETILWVTSFMFCLCVLSL